MPCPKIGFALPFNRKCAHCVLAVLGIFIYAQAFSQQQLSAANDASGIDNLRAIYLGRIGESSPLYNGVQYIRDGRPASGFPFFASDSMQQGAVTVAGFTHSDVGLYYDLVSDDLVAENYTHTGLFRIPRANVSAFTLGGSRFVHLQADTTHGSVIREGYYEYIDAGALTLLIRWQKALETRPGYEDPAYKTYSYYYLRKDGIYFPLDGRKSLLRLLKDKEDDVRKFIGAEKLDFKKDPKSAYARALQYYTGLK